MRLITGCAGIVRATGRFYSSRLRRLRSLSCLLFLALLLLPAPSVLFAAKNEKDLGLDQETPVEDYYRAMRLYAIGRIAPALKEFENFDKKYPVSPLAKNVKIMIPYLQYLDRQYDIAIQSIDGFLSMYPRTHYEPYLQYMRALCSYRQVTGIRKAQEMRIRSRAEMSSVADRFPTTVYGASAKRFANYLDLLTVYSDLLVGQFYQQDRSYFAAINRFKSVIDAESFLSSKAFSTIAYYRLKECYHDLGVADMEAKYNALFNKSARRLNGPISFDIEGLVRYISPEDLASTSLKETEKLARKQAKVALRNKGSDIISTKRQKDPASTPVPNGVGESALDPTFQRPSIDISAARHYYLSPSGMQ